ncbi:hypothetical protein C8R47DRAFT_1095467 [Mycena vitilis]|nr:hypothetical protein C8R47DRAFT_1095467 [Mycena vitilis]
MMLLLTLDIALLTIVHHPSLQWMHSARRLSTPAASPPLICLTGGFCWRLMVHQSLVMRSADISQPEVSQSATEGCRLQWNILDTSTIGI